MEPDYEYLVGDAAWWSPDAGPRASFADGGLAGYAVVTLDFVDDSASMAVALQLCRLEGWPVEVAWDCATELTVPELITVRLLRRLAREGRAPSRISVRAAELLPAQIEGLRQAVASGTRVELIGGADAGRHAPPAADRHPDAVDTRPQEHGAHVALSPWPEAVFRPSVSKLWRVIEQGAGRDLPVGTTLRLQGVLHQVSYWEDGTETSWRFVALDGPTAGTNYTFNTSQAWGVGDPLATTEVPFPRGLAPVVLSSMPGGEPATPRPAGTREYRQRAGPRRRPRASRT